MNRKILLCGRSGRRVIGADCGRPLVGRGAIGLTAPTGPSTGRCDRGRADEGRADDGLIMLIQLIRRPNYETTECARREGISSGRHGLQTPRASGGHFHLEKAALQRAANVGDTSCAGGWHGVCLRPAVVSSSAVRVFTDNQLF